MGSHGTFVLRRLGSVAFKLFAAIDLYSVNSGRVAANWSAGCATEFENIGRNVVIVLKVVRLKPDQSHWWLWPCTMTQLRKQCYVAAHVHVSGKLGVSNIQLYKLLPNVDIAEEYCTRVLHNLEIECIQSNPWHVLI